MRYGHKAFAKGLKITKDAMNFKLTMDLENGSILDAS
jgi:hypothetical protein